MLPPLTFESEKTMEKYENDFYLIEYSDVHQSLIHVSKVFHIDDHLEELNKNLLSLANKYRPRFYIADLTNISVVDNESSFSAIKNFSRIIALNSIEKIFICPPKKDLGNLFFELMKRKIEEITVLPDYEYVDSLDDAFLKIDTLKKSAS